MNNLSIKIIIGLVIIVLIGVGGYVVTRPTMQEEAEVSVMTNEAATGTSTSDALAVKGSYEPYSVSKLTNATNGDVVLFFRAGWCPTCRALDADIKANISNIPQGLTILDVDYDNSFELKKKYGVTYQHTFVQVDSSGNLIKKWSGSPSLTALAQEVK